MLGNGIITPLAPLGIVQHSGDHPSLVLVGQRLAVLIGATGMQQGLAFRPRPHRGGDLRPPCLTGRLDAVKAIRDPIVPPLVIDVNGCQHLPLSIQHGIVSNRTPRHRGTRLHVGIKD